MVLGDLQVGDRGRVVGFYDGCSLYRSHLLALGLTPGVNFLVKNISPLGDPLAIEVRGCILALRADEARILHIEKL